MVVAVLLVLDMPVEEVGMLLAPPLPTVVVALTSSDEQPVEIRDIPQMSVATDVSTSLASFIVLGSPTALL